MSSFQDDFCDSPPGVPGADGFVDLGTLDLPSSSSQEEAANAASKLLEEMRGTNSLLGMIKRQDYKHPDEKKKKGGGTVTKADIEGMMKVEESKDIIGDLVGDDGIVPPDVYKSSVVGGGGTNWRDALSESLLSSIPGTMKTPPGEDMDEGAKMQLKEVEAGERSKDQFSMYSGFEKPESYRDDDD